MFINNQLTPFPYLMGQLNNISPLTYRDGATYLTILEKLISYVQETQTPELQNILDGVVKDFQAGIGNAETAVTQAKIDWQTLFEDFIQNFQNELMELNDGAVSQLVADTSTDTHGAVAGLISAANTTLDTELRNFMVELAGDLESELTTAINDKISTTTKGAPNGVATLDNAGKVPQSQLFPTSLAGNYAQRPAANTVANGGMYYSLDTVENYRSNGNAWTRVGRGGYQGSAALVTLFESSSTTPVDVPGLAVTFTAGTGTTKFTVSGEALNTVNDGLIILVVEVNGVDSGHINIQLPTPNAVTSFTRVLQRTDLIPGNVYTVKIKMLVGYATGGFGKLDGQPYNPVTLMVEAQ